MVGSVGAVLLLSRPVCRNHYSSNIRNVLFVVTCFAPHHSSGRSLLQQSSTLTRPATTFTLQSCHNLSQSRNTGTAKININSNQSCWNKRFVSTNIFSHCHFHSQSCLHSIKSLNNNMCDCSKKRVCIVGSGNWGSAIAKIVGANTRKHDSIFEEEVRMYVYEELVDGRKLTEIINEDHENVKYLPGHKLPTNVVAIPDIVDAAGECDIIIFVLPHQFIKATCKPLVGKTKAGAFGVSLIKGFDIADGGGIDLISHIITRFLSIPCSVLMGANLANEIALEKFSETTIGTHDVEQGQVLHTLFQTDFFRVVVVADVETVEICGALKNIVAVGAGFVDGLQYGDNTKAAVIRLGLMEMVRFSQEFYGGKNLSTFLESCGVADLITTCYGGRNRKVSEAFVRTGKTLAQLEEEMLNGQRLQGPMTAAEVHHMLEARGLKEKFPLFTAVHRICTGELKPADLIDCIRNHPEHIASTLSKSSL